MASASGKPYLNKRKEPRQPYVGHLTFAYKNRLYEGKLKNYSPSGLFIETDRFLLEGEIITVVLPYFSCRNNIRTARIVRTNTEGCGVKLVE